MYKFTAIEYEKLNDNVLSKYKDLDIYMTYEWLTFLNKALNVKPIVIEIKKENEIIGYFVGATFKKFGIKIVGSPFRGWDTPYMGFILNNNESRIEIIPELWKFLKKEFKTQYMEICDRRISFEDIEKTNFKYIVESTYAMDISNSDEELLSSFTKHCRKDLRVFCNRGATVKQVEYSKDFLDRFYDMLTNVFKVQGLVPPYSKEKLETLFETINNENMLCIETYNPDGKSIGMSVSFGYDDKCYAFASATDRTENYNQKNYLRWYAIQYWKTQGKKYYDLMGKRDYKLEFSPKTVEYYRIVLTKWKLLLPLRNCAKKAYWLLNKIRFMLKKKERSNEVNIND